VVVKIMEQPEICKGCSEAHACARAYEQLGKAEGPSVALKAIVAFLLPIAAFAGTLAVCDALLEGAVAPRYETPIACVIALATTVALVLVVSTMIKRRHRTGNIRNGLM
jgi:hypothetical protein